MNTNGFVSVSGNNDKTIVPNLKRSKVIKRVIRLVAKTLVEEGYWLAVEVVSGQHKKTRIVDHLCEQLLEADSALLHLFWPASALPCGTVSFDLACDACLSSWSSGLDEVIGSAIELSSSKAVSSQLSGGLQ